MRRRQQGIALMLAIFFSILLFMLSFAFLKLVPMELASARRDHVKAEAYFVHSSMIQAVWAWLRRCEDVSGNPLLGLSPQTSGDAIWPVQYRLNSSAIPGFQMGLLNGDGSPDARWSADILLFPDERTRAGSGPHTFRVRVSARLWGQPIAAADYLLQQQTFAKYGFFVDKLPNGGYYTAMRDDIYEGEFHVNGKLPLYVDPQLFANFVAPVFRGRVTFTQAQSTNPYDSVAYTSSSAKPFDSNGATIVDSDGRSRYSKLCSLDRSGIRMVADTSMPATNINTEFGLAKAAWFGRVNSADSLASAAVPSGVNLNRLADGTLAGIYVKGNVRDLTLRVVDSSTLDVARNAEGRLDSGNALTQIREENAATAGQTLYTRILEMRDPGLTWTIPSNTQVSYSGQPATLTSSNTSVGPGKTIVMRDPGTTLNPAGTALYQVYDGFPNGVLYVDGNIGAVPRLDTEQAGGSAVNRDSMRSNYLPANGPVSQGGLQGVNRGAPRTVAVNLARNNYVRLAGDLCRGDTTPGGVPSGRQDGMGIVGYDVVVGGEIIRNGDVKPLYLYSLLMAGRRDTTGVTQPGSMIYEDWDTRTGWGRFFSYGSCVVGNDRIWGNNGGSGWMPSFRHDSTLAYNPPPFYPARTDYKLQAFRELSP